MAQLSDSLSFHHGTSVANRITLAPLTNQQSYADGTLSEAEYHWLTMRAQGGFGLTMTCASHVQAVGQGFPGQLGCFDDRHRGSNPARDGNSRGRINVGGAAAPRGSSQSA